MRNRIVNGDMRVDQANAGASVSVAAAATVRSVDKWSGFGSVAAGVFSLQQQTNVQFPGFSSWLRATSTTADATPAAGSLYLLTQTIEGTFLEDSQLGLTTARVLSLSFKVRSSLTGTFSASIRNAATNRSYPFSFIISVANTVTNVAISLAGDITGIWVLTNAASLILTFDLGSGATTKTATAGWQAGNFTGVTGASGIMATNGSTFDITGVQLEVSNGATSFDYLPFAWQLILCQREFWKTFNQATAPVQNAGTVTGELRFQALTFGAVAIGDSENVPFPVVMRAAPAMVFFNPSAANAQARDITGGLDCSGTSGINVTERSFTAFTVSNAVTALGNQLGVHVTADARL